MADLGRELAEKNSLSWDDILWLGAGAPGTVNIEKGALEYANNIGITYAPLKKMLEKILGHGWFDREVAHTQLSPRSPHPEK